MPSRHHGKASPNLLRVVSTLVETRTAPGLSWPVMSRRPTYPSSASVSATLLTVPSLQTPLVKRRKSELSLSIVWALPCLPGQHSLAQLQGCVMDQARRRGEPRGRSPQPAEVTLGSELAKECCFHTSIRVTRKFYDNEESLSEDVSGWGNSPTIISPRTLPTRPFAAVKTAETNATHSRLLKQTSGLFYVSTA